MLLENKNAILYGAAGNIGSAVALSFAREGARVFLTGRNLRALEKLAGKVKHEGGKAEIAQVDALDADAVETHLATVAGTAVGVDISFNMISLGDVQGTELAAMEIDDYLRPIKTATLTQFITATAAARHMTARGRGVILAITATPSRLALPLVGGFGTACCAIEGMMRTLAAEVGPKGVRVCWLRSAGSPESFEPTPPDAPMGKGGGITNAEYQEMLKAGTLLKRFPKLAEIGKTAALVASDHASAMSGAAANATCGQIVD